MVPRSGQWASSLRDALANGVTPERARGVWTYLREVYANSYCTIAAATASNSDGGLFRNRLIKDISYGKILCNLLGNDEQGFKMLIILQMDDWNAQINPLPLSLRAWTLQERVLSSRVLFFGDHQILWKCDSSRKSEAFREGIPSNYGPVMETPAGDIQKRIQLKPGAIVGELVHAWSLLLRTYTRRDLTHSSNKLVAMA
jgi:hypothetical protein